jgi:hypothetical protein
MRAFSHSNTRAATKGVANGFVLMNSSINSVNVTNCSYKKTGFSTYEKPVSGLYN